MAVGGTRAWVGEAIVSLALSATGLWFVATSGRMPMFEDGVPGPGLTPAILGIALTALGIAIAAHAMWKRPSGRLVVFDRDSALATALLLVAVLSFEGAGYLLSTFLFLLASFVLIGRERWLSASIVAAAATLLTWALFVKALGVPLPAGILSIS
jgi:hypothetical protein